MQKLDAPHTRHSRERPPRSSSAQPVWRRVRPAEVGHFAARGQVPRILPVAIFLSFGVFCYLIIFDGAVDVDEGFYLLAARAVYQGHLPYRDFAFSQTPLVPYVYGLPQLLYPGILTGRLTSLVLTVLALGVTILYARRVGVSENGLILISALICLNEPQLYYLLIVKTYALSFLLLVTNLYSWSYIRLFPKRAIPATTILLLLLVMPVIHFPPLYSSFYGILHV